VANGQRGETAPVSDWHSQKGTHVTETLGVVQSNRPATGMGVGCFEKGKQEGVKKLPN